MTTKPTSLKCVRDFNLILKTKGLQSHRTNKPQKGKKHLLDLSHGEDMFVLQRPDITHAENICTGLVGTLLDIDEKPKES